MEVVKGIKMGIFRCGESKSVRFLRGKLVSSHGWYGFYDSILALEKGLEKEGVDSRGFEKK